MRFWFMRIFARPKKTHEPRSGCINYVKISEEFLPEKPDGFGIFEEYLHLMCKNNIGSLIEEMLLSP